MGEISAVATAGLTVGFVWLVSFFANKLESLPIDFAVAGLSLILLFFDLADREMHSGQSFGGLNPVWVIGFVVAITVFFSAFTVGVFKAARGKPRQTVFSEKVFREIGYWVSLALATIFLVFAVSAASSTAELIRVNLEARGGVANFFKHVTSQIGGVSFWILVIFLAITIVFRYLELGVPKARVRRGEAR